MGIEDLSVPPQPSDNAPHIMRALLMTLAAGLSTGLGGLIIMVRGEPSLPGLGHMLSFSAGVMIYISFMDLMHDAIEVLGYLDANIWFFIGMLFFHAVVYFIPEPEIDPDLVVSKAKTEYRARKALADDGKMEEPMDKSLFRTGVHCAIGLSLHNFPEGIAVYLACLRGLDVGLPLLFAIACHNIPEGMAVAAPIYGSTGSKWIAFKWSLLSGICEPVAALLVGLFTSSQMSEYTVHAGLAAVAGIMVYMSFVELIPTTLKYTTADQAVKSFIGGMIVIFLSIHCLHAVLSDEGFEDDDSPRSYFLDFFTSSANQPHPHRGTPQFRLPRPVPPPGMGPPKRIVQ